MAISLDKLTGLNERVLKARNDRLELIAGNLANADTPGYKAKDLDFQQALKNAQSRQSYSLDRTHSKHFDVTLRAPGDIKYRIPTQPDTGDGNTVEVQMERNNFLEVGMRYQASLDFLSGKFRGMTKALGGGQGG